MKSFFITGTNTDIGKTFITTALLRSFLKFTSSAVAIKPIQSGTDESGLKDFEIYKNAGESENLAPLYMLKFPASPHFAARLESVQIILEDVKNYCEKIICKHEMTLIEGAGGIYVPINERENMLDLILALNLGVILVCKNELGALNNTILSIKALENAGAKIDLIVLNFTDLNDKIHVSNLDYLRANFPYKIIVLPKFDDKNLDEIALNFDEFAQESLSNLDEISASANSLPPSAQTNLITNEQDQILDESHNKTRSNLTPCQVQISSEQIDLNFDKKHLFHPYTSITKPLKTYAVTGAKGSYIFTQDGALIDGMSSWWCECLGYGREELKAAAHAQIDTFSHVMFGGLTHAPAINLGKKLLSLLPSQLDVIFYADSGSVGVEVAIKMALQYQQNRAPHKNKIATFKGGYHGDTFGAMSVCDPINGMHSLFRGVLAKQIFMPRPKIPYGAKFSDKATKKMEKIIMKNRDKIAAIIVEPLVQGAGGMWFYHENYLKFLRKICDKIGALLIFDEIATGFGRTGAMFACEKAGVVPDIITLGKALTGGMLSFATTICSRRVAEGVCENGVFMHGPTFMANPLACAVALESITQIERLNVREKVGLCEQILRENLAFCANLDGVVDVRVMGAIGVVEMARDVDVERIQAFFIKRGVWIRPFGKNIYIMPHFTASRDEIIALCEAIREAILAGEY